MLDKSRLTHLKKLIEEGLKKARLKISDIDIFGVGVGRFFYSLRIGISAVKALSYGLHKPVVEYSSLDAIAFSQPDV